jgi:broad specificity phosphatase PhoE
MEQKKIFCIRHGTALHNNLFWTMGKKAYMYYHDTPLVEKGWCEAEFLAKEWKTINDIDLVVVSPLMRTLSTAETIFKDREIPIVVYDGIKEYPQSGEWCNLRSCKFILKSRFPKFDFSNLKTENDETWQWEEMPKTQSMAILNGRINMFKQWIMQRPEKNIAVISHSSFLGQLMYGSIGDEQNELKHCFPYEYVVSI